MGAVVRAHNKQLERTVITQRGDGTSAPFHYALVPRFMRQRAAAQLRRYAARPGRIAGRRSDVAEVAVVSRESAQRWAIRILRSGLKRAT